MHSYEASGVWGLGNHMYVRQTGCGERASNKNMNSWTPKDWLVSVTVCCERIQLIVNCDVTFRNNQPQFNPSVPRTYSSKQTKCYFPWTSGGGRTFPSTTDHHYMLPGAINYRPLRCRPIKGLHHLVRLHFTQFVRVDTPSTCLNTTDTINTYGYL